MRDDSPDPSPFPDYPQLTRQVLASIVSLATGDARRALSLLELALNASPTADQASLLSTLRKSVSTAYDRTGDDHYGKWLQEDGGRLVDHAALDLISALHKVPYFTWSGLFSDTVLPVRSWIRWNRGHVLASANVGRRRGRSVT
jgi:hypothetical protein